MPTIDQKQFDDLGASVTGFIDRGSAAIKELKERVLNLEQKAVTQIHAFSGGSGSDENLGSQITESTQFKSFQTQGIARTGRISVGSFHKTAMVNATGLNQPLVQAYRMPGVVVPGQQRLTVRDLLPTAPTSSNMIEYALESGYTNAADMQGNGSSPQQFENVAKAESALAYALKYAPVQTLAHWIPISKQLLDDATGLQAYINNRLLYGLKLKEEGQLLNGDGTGANLKGLVTCATAYDVTMNKAGETKIDTIRHALKQVALANYDADAIIMHPSDWEDVELIKTTGTASSGEYIITDPRRAGATMLWGKPVVATKSMAAGHFLVGSFAAAATIWDRSDAVVEVSREHADFFVKNMAAVLCEERLALTVFREDALIYGAFPQ